MKVLTSVRVSVIASTECPECGMTLQAYLDADEHVDPMEAALGKLGEYIEKHSEWHREAHPSI